MKIIEPSVEVIFHNPIHPKTGMTLPIEVFLERAGRTCYKSEDRITPTSAADFVRMIERRGHHSVVEHGFASVRFVCDRGVTHELVRHRLASYSQESTRYCNYTKESKGGAIGVIMPPFEFTDNDSEDYREKVVDEWAAAMLDCERHYFNLIEFGQPPQLARYVLPIGLKTEIVMSCNIREWMHVFSQRCSKAAHPGIRGLMLQVLDQFAEEIPTIFQELKNRIVLSD